MADPSNADDRHARSRLRQRLWPDLQLAFADAEGALCAVARRAQEARHIVDEVARTDLARVADASGLQVAAWAGLGSARQANVLRHWLGRLLSTPVPESLVQRLVAELPGRRGGSWPAGEAPLRLHAGVLAPVPVRPAVQPGSRTGPGPQPAVGTHLAGPWPGSIGVDPTTEGGVPAALLQRAELRPRSGGEQFQAHAQSPPRSLKKQFQDGGVPAWQRDGPLVWADGRLVYVPGLGHDARVLALPGSPRVLLNCLP